MKHLTTVLTLLLAMYSSATFAQKIGHVNLQKIINDMPQYKTAQDTLEIEQKKIQIKLQKMEAEYNRVKALYQDSAKYWSLAERTLQQTRLTNLEQNYQQYYQLASASLDTMQEKMLNRIFKKIKKATQTVAKEKGFSYVLNYTEQTVLYYDPALDLTAEVRKKLGLL
ncbi:hypothetical protein GC194_02320 [bacterium]|nr:hypothetical protein [bacterium]